MNFLKKEWKVIVLILCLIGVTIYLACLNSRLTQLQRQVAKIASTVDSVESITLNTDASISDQSKKVDEIESDVDYIVKKIRRR